MCILFFQKQHMELIYQTSSYLHDALLIYMHAAETAAKEEKRKYLEQKRKYLNDYLARRNISEFISLNNLTYKSFQQINQSHGNWTFPQNWNESFWTYPLNWNTSHLGNYSQVNETFDLMNETFDTIKVISNSSVISYYIKDNTFNGKYIYGLECVSTVNTFSMTTLRVKSRCIVQSTLDISNCQGTNKFVRDIDSSTYRVVILRKLIRIGPIVLFETSRVRLIEYSRFRDSTVYYY